MTKYSVWTQDGGDQWFEADNLEAAKRRAIVIGDRIGKPVEVRLHRGESAFDGGKPIWTHTPGGVRKHGGIVAGTKSKSRQDKAARR